MTDKLITHEEALDLVRILYFNINEKNYRELNKTSKIYSKLDDYIVQQKQLSKDVARYFEILESNVSYVFLGTQDICDEFDKLEEKLSKVGNEE